MKIEFTGRQVEVSAELRRLVERKLAKLSRLLPRVTRAHVVLGLDRHLYLAEVSVHSRQLDFLAREASSDPGASLAAAVDKLTTQVKRRIGRRRVRGREGSLRTAVSGAAPPAREGRAEAAPRIVRSRRRLGKPMSLEEAAAEVMARREGFLVFRDPASERVNVLYRRKDGNLGLIDPEA
jgi:putative sigma-54 modulation protein